MFKGIFQGKKRESSVIRTDMLQFPTFDELAPKTIKKIETEIWKLTHEELHSIIQSYEGYIESLRISYEGVMELYQPLQMKYEILEKERKKISQDLEERTFKVQQLEQHLLDLQSELEQEQMKHEFTKMKLDEGQNQEEPNLSDDDTDVIDIEPTPAIKKGEQQEFKQLQQLVQQSQFELQLQNRKNRELDSYVKSLLQQIVELQSRHRGEIDQSKRMNAELTLMINQLKSELEASNSAQQQDVQRNFQFAELQDAVSEQLQAIQQLQKEKQTLISQLNEQQDKLASQESIITKLNQKRELAISEIKKLTQLGPANINQELNNWKQLKLELLDALMNRRRLFDTLYKTFLNHLCVLEEQYGAGASKALFKLERDMNSMVIGMQELIDEIDDIE